MRLAKEARRVCAPREELENNCRVGDPWVAGRRLQDAADLGVHAATSFSFPIDKRVKCVDTEAKRGWKWSVDQDPVA